MSDTDKVPSWIPSEDEICAAFHSAVGTTSDAFAQIRKLIVNCYTYRNGVQSASPSSFGERLTKLAEMEEKADPSTGLLPCPFCGGRAVAFTDADDYGYQHGVMCEACDARGETTRYNVLSGDKELNERQRKKAHAHWNRRNSFPAIRAALGRSGEGGELGRFERESLEHGSVEGD